MPFDGNGNYTPASPGYPAVSGAIIYANDWNDVTADIATALTNCVTRDGQSPPSANLPMGGKKFTNLAIGGATGEALTWEQVFSGTPAFPNGATATTQVGTDNTTKLATTAFVQAAAFNSSLPGQAGNAGKYLTTDGVNASWGALPAALSGGRVTPTGAIIMWSGSIGTIPSGWALCDGTNGTPDLRDKFIISARSDSLGVAKTNVTGALTQAGGTKDALVVSHTHSFSGTNTSATELGNHSHPLGDPGHVHSMFGGNIGRILLPGVGGGGNYGAGPAATGDYANTAATTTGMTIGAQDAAHTHVVTITGTTGSTGASGTDGNLPPYYALAFIMCLA